MNVDIPPDLIQIARQLQSNNRLQRAFDLFICIFEQNPIMKEHLQVEFRNVMTILNRSLEMYDNREQIDNNFDRAMNNFPDSAEILNEVGKYFYRNGHVFVALCLLQKALTIEGSNVKIERNTNDIKNVIFPRRKFRALNDKIRNEAYYNALKATLVPGKDSVLDINCGTGLLSLFATDFHPTSIIGCEESSAIIELAKNVIVENDANISLINNTSVALTTNNLHTVLLTDLFDCGLFGEFILVLLKNAWANVLDRNAKVIPGKAEFFIIGTNCDDLNAKFQLRRAAKSLLNIKKLNVHISTDMRETYCEADVTLYDVNYLTDPVSLLTTDFNSIKDIEEKLYRMVPYTAELLGKENGEINTVIGWFNLHLTDEIIVTTDPRNDLRVNAWRQAVFFDILPKKIKKEENAVYDFLPFGGRLSSLKNGEAVTRISPECLRYLNDEVYANMIVKRIAVICVYLGQTIDISSVQILDLNPFPLLGLLLLKRGAKSLTCWVKSGDDKEFFKSVFRTNNIDLHKVEILETDFLQSTMFSTQFHLIYTNTIGLNGDVCTDNLKLAKDLRQSHLHRDGLFLPAKISIIGQLVNCPSLDLNNKVSDENCLNFKIAGHVNRYQVSQMAFLDVDKLKFKAISEPSVVVDSLYDMATLSVKQRAVTDGEVNAILCWYQIQLLLNMNDILCTNKGSSFVEGMAFLPEPNLKLSKDNNVNIIVYVDDNNAFKIALIAE